MSAKPHPFGGEGVGTAGGGQPEPRLDVPKLWLFPHGVQITCTVTCGILEKLLNCREPPFPYL